MKVFEWKFVEHSNIWKISTVFSFKAKVDVAFTFIISRIQICGRKKTENNSATLSADR